MRRNRDVRMVSAPKSCPTWVTGLPFVALAGLVEDVTDSRFLVSLVLVSMTIPGLFMSPIAGSFADRFDRRKILNSVSVLQAFAALLLLLLHSVSRNLDHICCPVPHCCTCLVRWTRPPAHQFPIWLDNEDDLRKTNALFGSTWGIMLAVGAALGGVFAAAFGRNAAFIANAVSFLLASGTFCKCSSTNAKCTHRTTQLRDEYVPLPT